MNALVAEYRPKYGKGLSYMKDERLMSALLWVLLLMSPKIGADSAAMPIQLMLIVSTI